MKVANLKKMLDMCNDDATIRLYYEGYDQEIKEGNCFDLKRIDANDQIVNFEFD